MFSTYLWGQLPAVLGGVSTCFITGYVIYQVFLHPLAAYPGPLLSKLTDLYSVWHAWRGTRHSDLYRLHKIHGDIVRFGPDKVSICSASALEPIYGHKANVEKGSFYNVFYGASIFNVTNKEVHARKKRVMSQAFSDQAIRGLQPHIMQVIDGWTNALADNIDAANPAKVGDWSSAKDMAPWSAYLIFDVLGELLFGESYETSLRPDNRYFLELMKFSVKFLYIVGQMPALKKLGLGRLAFRGLKSKRDAQLAFSRRQMQARNKLGSDTDRRDIFYYLLQARDPETGLGYSSSELQSECTLLLGAGSDTANTGLAAAFFFLAQNPATRARLTTTVRSTFPTVDSIVSGPLLNSCSYLRACIDEALRLCPPLPMPLPRKVLSGGLIVDGRAFPAGTTVGVPTYALHHSGVHFPDPFAFNPSRWLVSDGTSEEAVQLARDAFVPFSIGPRACIGRGVALLELYVAIARAVWLYDWRTVKGTEANGMSPSGEYAMKDHFVVWKEGPVLQFKLRTEA